MVDAGHGVVQVGQVGHTGVNGGFGMVIVRIGVGDGHGAKFLGLGNELRRAGQLGSHVHDAHQAAAAFIQRFEAFKIRLLQVVGVLGAPLLVGEVGTFHLNAHEPGQTLGGLVC